MKTLIFILAWALMLSATHASDYIVVRIYEGQNGLIAISPEDALKQNITHLPKGVVIKYQDLKGYGVQGSIFGKPIAEDDLKVYLEAPAVAAK